MKNIALFAVFFLLLGPMHPVSAQKTIDIATDVWIPYENISNKEAPGFSTEVVQLVFATLGEKIQITEYPWMRALARIKVGESAALYTAFHDEERAAYAYYPEEPLARDKWIFLSGRKILNVYHFPLLKT